MRASIRLLRTKIRWVGSGDVNRSVRFTKTIEPGDKTAVFFTWVFNNDVINKNTAVRFTWFQNTFETTFGGSF